MAKRDNETRADRGEIGRSVALPVLDQQHSRAPMMGRTKIGRVRAIVLIAINVLMLAHLAQWLIVGMTVSPIEPSESMETLEVGVVNAGAVFFLLAILSTILLGRFFCGWACHIVALQDLCAYMMTKVGVRPKPFRSRLLVYFPFFLGMYMFVWPSFKRSVLAPALESMSIGWPVWLRPVEPIHQWTAGLIVDDFWATMPPWFVAVPFLLICGFAAVYFLGAKGFCTYGCPYAAFFKPLDKVAPVRIRVNDDCQQCGYCTSACTSNVRVSEEVRDFGMVVDPGCMKTLDCISACPNDALSLGIGRPALLAKPRSPETYIKAKEKRSRRFDMSLSEELLAAGLLLWFFFATRGSLDAVPMLLAGGLAAIGAMVVITAIKLFHKDNVRLYRFTLRSRKRVKPAGYALMLLAIGFIVASVWSGNARLLRWRGDMLYAETDMPTSSLMRVEFLPNAAQRRRAESAVAVYQRADSFERGGLGWTLDAEHRLRLAYFLTMLGRFDDALNQSLLAIDEGSPTGELVLQAGQLSTRAVAQRADDTNSAAFQTQARTRLLEIYQRALDAHPKLHPIRAELAKSAFSVGDKNKADAYWDVSAYADDPEFALARAQYLSFTGQMPQAQSQFERAAELSSTLDRPAGMLINIAQGALQNGMSPMARELAQRAVEHHSATAQTWLGAGEIANATGDRALGKERAQRALSMDNADRPLVQARAAGVLAGPGDTGEARALLADAARRAQDPFDTLYITQGMVRGGAGLGDMEMINQGLSILGDTVEAHPDLSLLRHDYASMLYSIGRSDEAKSQMIEAAERDGENPILASRVAELCRLLGDQELAGEWTGEAARRSAALKQRSGGAGSAENGSD